MKAKARRSLFALAIGSLVVLVAAQTALAHAPSAAAGSGEDTSATLIDARFADGNFFGSFVVTGVMDGTFDGTYVADVDLIIHPNGRLDAHGFLTFTGSIAGCDATTVLFSLTSTGAFPEGGGPAVIEGQLVAVGSDVQANLAFDEVGNFFTYDGSYHCEQ
jgi:hypothetical protein